MEGELAERITALIMSQVLPYDSLKLASDIRALMEDYNLDGVPSTITNAEILQRVSISIKLLDMEIGNDVS